ncbi:hypothetical protein P8452_23876 [Trifolium repens]|nr:hypothetical protein P8452_23876 [Trifolium repens]
MVLTHKVKDLSKSISPFMSSPSSPPQPHRRYFWSMTTGFIRILRVRITWFHHKSSQASSSNHWLVYVVD